MFCFDFLACDDPVGCNNGCRCCCCFIEKGDGGCIPSIVTATGAGKDRREDDACPLTRCSCCCLRSLFASESISLDGTCIITPCSLLLTSVDGDRVTLEEAEEAEEEEDNNGRDKENKPFDDGEVIAPVL